MRETVLEFTKRRHGAKITVDPGATDDDLRKAFHAFIEVVVADERLLAAWDSAVQEFTEGEKNVDA